MRTKKIKVALLVDNPYRDLPGLVLVACALAKKGFQVYLTPMNLREQEIWSIAPDFVLINHLRTIYDEFIQKMLNAKIKVGVLDTEGGVYFPLPVSAFKDSEKLRLKFGETLPPYEEYVASLTHNAELRDAISLYCSWGQNFASYATQRNWYREDQVVVTGVPRSDWLTPKWNPAIHKKEQSQCTSILFLSNFTIANSKFLSPEDEISFMINNFDFSQEYVENFCKAQEVAFKGFTELVKNTSEKFPEITIIYRPHPFESSEIYHKEFSQHSNVKIENRGTIDSALREVDAVIVWGSSSAIDASLLNKPVLLPDWIPLHIRVEDIDDVSHICTDQDDFHDQLTRIADGSYEIPPAKSRKIEEVHKRIFHELDGNSHSRVAQAIAQKTSSTPSTVDHKVAKTYFFKKQYYTTWKGHLYNRFRSCYSYFLPNKSVAKWLNSEKHYNTSDVFDILKKIQKQGSNSYKKISIDQSKKHFLFHKKKMKSIVINKDT